MSGKSDSIEMKPVGKSAPPPPPRHPDTAPGGLGAAYRSAEDKAKAAVHLQEGNLDSISVWGLVASAWFGLLALPLLLFPRILLFFAQTPPAGLAAAAAGLDRDHYDNLTPLESFLALTLALGLISMAIFTFLILVPSYDSHPNPSRWSLLSVEVGLTSLMSAVSWNSPVGGLGKVVGLGNIVVAAWGWWVIIFGQGRGKLAGVGKKHHPQRWEKL